jgi:hypothetical protein
VRVPSPPLRVALALTALVATALLPACAVLVQLLQSPGWYRPHDDAVSAYERRCAALRAALHGAAVVGYLAPALPAASQTASLYMMQYSLAPIEVVDDPDHTLVVADGMPDRSRVPPGLAVRRDFGNGLLLLERRDGPAP